MALAGTAPADSVPAGTTRRAVRTWDALSATAVALTGLFAGVLFSRRSLDSYDAQIMYAVGRSIATTHTTVVPAAADAFHRNTPHSSYGLGQSLLEAPAYLLATHTGHDPQTFAMLVNPVLFGAIALVVWAWARTAGARPVQAAVVALASGFGTLLLAYTPTGGSELGTALGIAVAILGVEVASRRPVVGSVVAGAGVGVAVLWRPDSVFLVAVPVAIAALIRSRRAFPLFLLATAPVAVATVLYFGLQGARYQGVTPGQGFSHPLGSGLYGLLLSPGRGLLLYVPLVLPALAAVPWAWRRSALVTGLCLALLVIRVVFYARWFSWNGGWAWGPRFLVPAMPALAPLLLEIVRRLKWRRWPLAAAAAAVLLISTSVQVLGAAVRYDTDTANLTMTAVWRSDWDSTPQDRVLFDWRYFPIREHLAEVRAGRNLAPGYRGPVGPS
ncbi:MAG TPA: hypothetical protein VLW53_08965 [Candidatus Eisenbacteria bacterium]|nr:hypothetical protein [Candidatus Eisenbacteria bacterium]